MTRSGSYRSVLAALALVAAGFVLPAAVPTPRATPSPTPIPIPIGAATTAPLYAPTVIVYPFETGGDLKADAGNAIAQIMNTELSSAGGLVVLPTPTNTKRVDYLTTALALKADYYISGYLTPVGDGASLVMQLVSTQSGIMIYSKTAQVYNAGDASAQAYAARDVMFAHSGIFAQAQDTATSSSTPAPTATQGANVSIGGIGSLFGLLHHKSATTATATVAEASKPDRIAIVARVTGMADGGALTAATSALRPALNTYFRTIVSTLPLDEGKGASAICGANRNASIVSGTLAQSTSGSFRRKTTSTFTLRVYACFGAVIFTGDPQAAGSVDAAVAAAVAAYAKDHPTNS